MSYRHQFLIFYDKGNAEGLCTDICHLKKASNDQTQAKVQTESQGEKNAP